MAWVDLADNQIPSFTDLSTSGLTLKSGQSHVTSTECPTRNQVLIKYFLKTGFPFPLSGYANNQLVPKSNIISSPSIILARFRSSNSRTFNCKIKFGSQDFIYQTTSSGCTIGENFIDNQNAVSTTSVNVELTTINGSTSETYNWSFRVLDRLTNSTVYYSNSGTVTATPSSELTIPLTVTGLTIGLEYFFEAIVLSTSCTV